MAGKAVPVFTLPAEHCHLGMMLVDSVCLPPAPLMHRPHGALPQTRPTRCRLLVGHCCQPNGLDRLASGGHRSQSTAVFCVARERLASLMPRAALACVEPSSGTEVHVR